LLRWQAGGAYGERMSTSAVSAPADLSQLLSLAVGQKNLAAGGDTADSLIKVKNLNQTRDQLQAFVAYA